MIQSIGSRRSPGGPEVKHGGHSQCSRFPNCNQKSVRPGRRRRNFRHWLYSHSEGYRTDWCTSQEQVEVEAEAAMSEAVEMAEMVEQQLALAMAMAMAVEMAEMVEQQLALAMAMAMTLAMAVSYSMAEMVEMVEQQMVELAALSEAVEMAEMVEQQLALAMALAMALAVARGAHAGRSPCSRCRGSSS